MIEIGNLGPVARALFVGTCFLTLGGNVAQADSPPVPSSTEVRRTVLRHFKALDDYQRGDLITRAQVEPLLAAFAKWGCLCPTPSKSSATFSPRTRSCPSNSARLPAAPSCVRFLATRTLTINSIG